MTKKIYSCFWKTFRENREFMITVRKSYISMKLEHFEDSRTLDLWAQIDYTGVGLTVLTVVFM